MQAGYAGLSPTSGVFTLSVFTKSQTSVPQTIFTCMNVLLRKNYSFRCSFPLTYSEGVDIFGRCFRIMTDFLKIKYDIELKKGM